MSYYLNAGLTGVGMLAPLSIPDEDRSDLYSPRFNWSYQARGPRSTRNPTLWRGLWPAPSMACGDAVANPGSTQFGQDASEASSWDEPICWDTGAMHLYGFTGQCLDASAVPQQNATVQAFVTATGQLAGTATSDNNGNYSVTTPYPGAHFLVAILAGSPDIFGTTDNNLIPTAL